MVPCEFLGLRIRSRGDWISIMASAAPTRHDIRSEKLCLNEKPARLPPALGSRSECREDTTDAETVVLR